MTTRRKSWRRSKARTGPACLPRKSTKRSGPSFQEPALPPQVLCQLLPQSLQVRHRRRPFSLNRQLRKRRRRTCRRLRRVPFGRRRRRPRVSPLLHLPVHLLPALRQTWARRFRRTPLFLASLRPQGPQLQVPRLQRRSRPLHQQGHLSLEGIPRLRRAARILS
jgi:hypothetical protein